ncbi:hypothetical protein FGE12_03520 [Aggregicoccus sp. 17bor-14]|uniref:hypothetical protein n=1 Tax=Myxococcaceae TaxID=31 RepID=UPI00129CE14B|nr:MULTISPECIES: hypothetical protein [Myxococcaceae]MBF5041442.1 hypothetical protein [Simulacricoccus sp. 17bor-14]MRI87226.1 hypothetical protein [Aggregicoccus sp. 17bor-14]
MARPRKASAGFSPTLTPALTQWAEALGEAVGRGVARGINAGVAGVGLGGGMPGARRRGRPPKAVSGGPVPADRRCQEPGCDREARSKGLCSAHYQARRRAELAKQA